MRTPSLLTLLERSMGGHSNSTGPLSITQKLYTFSGGMDAFDIKLNNKGTAMTNWEVYNMARAAGVVELELE